MSKSILTATISVCLLNTALLSSLVELEEKLGGWKTQKAEQPSVKKPEKRNDGSKKPQATLPSSKRFADCHKKVKQNALDVLAEIIGVLEDALNTVIIGLVDRITKNLNSNDPGVHTAAVKALEESIAHLVALMKEFSYQWSKLSGQALLDVTERITGLTGYPLAKRFFLASPSMLLPSKPLPPICQSSPSTKPSKVCSGEEENGKNGSGYEDKTRKTRSRFQRERDIRPRSSSRSKEESEHAGLTVYPLAKRFSLASPSMLLPSKPLPPIRQSSPSTKPSKVCSEEQENGENGSCYEDDSSRQQELSSEGKGHKELTLSLKLEQVLIRLFSCLRKDGILRKGVHLPPLSPPLFLAMAWGTWSNHGRPDWLPSCQEVSLASPSMLLPSKLLPPIRQSSPSTKPSKVCSGEQENGKNGSGYEDDSPRQQEWSSEGKGHKQDLKSSMSLAKAPAMAGHQQSRAVSCETSVATSSSSARAEDQEVGKDLISRPKLFSFF
ncbi:hypothetical protein DUI87_28442 [Hirundo rustica rustica]|uniref:TOG domain-containing protein n=1 Tax=Hirundo rustica rustica TaxID=333673 RepID=A0A3M0J0V8_HIRRU|nr:hypothetical protein DUI87_28442 [Hirundo rustica rustica]